VCESNIKYQKDIFLVFDISQKESVKEESNKFGNSEKVTINVTILLYASCKNLP